MARAALLAIVLLCAYALPAAARPRDDAMSGAFRCAAIGDLRVWLDCYYGAAQPVRAALSMPPAPRSQTALVEHPPAGQVPVDDVTVRDAVMAEAFRCNNTPDERQWLNCYYGAATGARARLGLASATPPKPAAPPPPAFGMHAKPRNEIPDSADHLAARLQSYSFDGDGMFTATLDNGQVWKQVSGDTDYAHWKQPARNYAIRISHGLFGSYNMQVMNQPGVFKVRRLE